MKKNAFLVCLALVSMPLFSQSIISGYILEEPSKEDKTVTLFQMNEETPSQKKAAKPIASSPIDAQGYFHFSEKLTDPSKFYYVSFKGKEKSIRSKKFLLNKDDSIFFEKSRPPLSKYKNSSITHKEWQRLLKYEQTIKGRKKYLDEIRTYSKDSLQILAVKLISLRELEKKQLLEKDIALNKEYYSLLLTELKESEIDPQEYLFLELKLTKLQILTTEESYAISKGLNIVLILLLFGTVVFVYRSKSSKQKLTMLSKQELAIKDLILEQKSNKEIATELFISVSTVKTHITNIYQKLQVVNRNDLITKFKNSTRTSP